jgi:hypothetical protein
MGGKGSGLSRAEPAGRLEADLWLVNGCGAAVAMS